MNAKITNVNWYDAKFLTWKFVWNRVGKRLIAEPEVRAIVQTPCPHAKALVLALGEAFSANRAVQAGVQIAALSPPAIPTPPIALAKRRMFMSWVMAKRRYAKVAERQPPTTNFLLPYLSAAIANGTRPIVLAIAETAVMAPILSAENPVSCR